jgi:ABC-type thiamine transport system substrate-binding protein
VFERKRDESRTSINLTIIGGTLLSKGGSEQREAGTKFVTPRQVVQELERKMRQGDGQQANIVVPVDKSALLRLLEVRQARKRHRAATPTTTP